MSSEEMRAELVRLQEALGYAKMDLYQYAKNASHDPVLSANYHHKMAQKEELETKIADIKAKLSIMQADG